MAILSLQNIRTVLTPENGHSVLTEYTNCIDAGQRDETRFNTNCNSLPESIELTIIITH